MSNVPPGAFPIDDPSLISAPVELPVSSFESPEFASQQSEAFLEGLRAERPEIQPSPSGVVELPGGYIDKAGVLHTEAVVRELTGADEERLAKINMAQNPVGYLRTLLDGVESIGGISPTNDVTSSLLTGDREALILGIRLATYGEDIPMKLTCPACQTEQDVAIELTKDVPVRKLEDRLKREFHIELRSGVAVAQLATAAVQDYVLQNRNSTLAEQKTATLEKCVISINGTPSNYQTVQNLGLADRKTLLDFLAETQPGPLYEEVSVPCSGCGKSFPLNLSLADLFRL